MEAAPSVSTLRMLTSVSSVSRHVHWYPCHALDASLAEHPSRVSEDRLFAFTLLV